MNKQLNLVVQISHKHHQRFERVSLSPQSGFTIGRAWNSDIVLQDSYVDADHLSLSMNDDGDIILNDRASVNGSIINGKPVQQGGQVYRLGEEIVVGDTAITIVDVAVGVAPAVMRSAWFGLNKHFSSLSSFIGLTVFSLLLATGLFWAFSTKPYGLPEAAVSLFSCLLLLLVWSMFFGFISKLVRGQSNFRMHWVLACLGIVFSLILGFALDIFRFNVQSLMVGDILSGAVYFIFGVLFVFATLSYSTYLTSNRKWVWSALSVLVIFGSVYSDTFLKKEHERWSAKTDTEQSTLPAAFLARQAVTVDQYFDDANAIFEFDEQQ